MVNWALGIGLVLMVATSGFGQVLELNGHPLSVHADERGTMGVLYSGRGPRTQEYYSTYAKGSALFLDGTNTAMRFGCGTSTFALWDQVGVDQFSPATHTMPGSNTIVTMLAAGQSGVRVTQTVTVQPPLPFYTIRWTIANLRQEPYTDLRFIHGGDVSPGGQDSTTGGWNVVSNMVFVLSRNFPPDFMGLLGAPTSLADAYHEGHFELVKNACKSGQLPNTIETNLHDAAYALQWNREVLGPGETWEINAIEVWPPATGEVQKAGGLLVLLEPQGARDGGAQWRATTGPDTSWHASGTTLSGLPTGEYAVVFSDIAAWFSPTQQVFAVMADQTTVGTGTYVEALGNAVVTLGPPEATADGAEWRLTTGPTTNWQATGTTLDSLPTGSYTVVCRDIAGWETPATQSVTVVHGETASAQGIYRLLGGLMLALEPQEARDAGAMWKTATSGDTNWRASGFVMTGLSNGEYTVIFANVDGWFAPTQQTYTVNNGVMTLDTATYIQALGNVTVVLEPPDAVGAGAQWRLMSGPVTNWQTNGAVAGPLPTGTYTLVYSDVAGWHTPGTQGVSVVHGETTGTSNIYTRMTGDLAILLQPQGAHDAGAMWRVTSGADTGWHTSGTGVHGIPVGEYDVAFQNIDGWFAPTQQTYTVYDGQMTGGTGTYVQALGNVTVALEPPDAIADGAVWRLITGPMTNWQASGAVVGSVPTGSHVVVYRDIAGWHTPNTQAVTITHSSTTRATGTYVEVAAQEQDVTAMLEVPIMRDWQLSRQTGTYFGNLHLKNIGQVPISGPIHVLLDSNTARQFMTPTGVYPDGRQYIDVTPQFNAAQPDGRLDPDDEIIVPGIEVYVRDRTVPPDPAFAVRATVGRPGATD